MIMERYKPEPSRQVMLDSFLDGFTGAGLFEKLSPPGRPDQFRLAMTSLTCGAVASLAVFTSICYLVVRGHSKSAYAVIGVQVLATIARFVRRRHAS